MLRRMGDLKVISLASQVANTCDSEKAWENEYSLATVPRTPKPDPVSSRLRTIKTLLFPFKNNWISWLNLILQHSNYETKAKPRLKSFQWILRQQHRFVSRFLPVPPVLCTSTLDTWLQIDRHVKSMLANDRFDLFWIENTVCWPVATDILKTLHHRPSLIVLNGHNIEYQVLEQQARSAEDALTEQYCRNESIRMKRMENSAFRKSDLVFQCSEMDTSIVRRLAPACNTHVFANGVDTLHFSAQHNYDRDPHPTVLFPGSFDYFPNREAAEWLATKIWPQVLKKSPTSRLIFAGRNAASLEMFARLADSIELASDVPDMRKYFARSWLVVAPLLSGGGTRLKILEALSSSRAVLSTTIGAEGVPYEKDRHLLLADNEEDFSDATIRLLQDHDLRERVANCGRQFVATHYDWNKICDNVATLLISKLAAR